jgi:UDP-glucose 4-epimerase
MKTALVTGGLGFIGSHAVIELLAENFNVVIIDNCSNSDLRVFENLKKLGGERVSLCEVDVANEREIYENPVLSRLAHLDWIIHFAAYKNVGESGEKPLDYYHNNIGGLLNILRFAKRVGCGNFIFSSSATIYAHSAVPPFIEDGGGAGAMSGRYSTIMNGPNPYGNTKIIGEQILHDLAHSEAKKSNADKFWNIVSLRYFNPVGAHPSGMFGEDYKVGKANNLFPAILGAYASQKSINVFGSDYDTHDGTAIRDYIHVVDLAKAHVLAAIKLDEARGINVYNVGIGNGKSVMEVLQAFRQAGLKIEWNIVDRREGDAPVSYCDNKRIREELGWSPQFGLKEMVEHSLKYFYNRIEEGWVGC